MIQAFWYEFMRIYIRTGLYFLHKKITVHGLENIPKKGAVLFIPNHQNALVDAILIPTTIKRKIYFLTRAAVFKNKLIARFFSTLNMLPVYRIRDGIKTIENNLAIFEKCFDILGQGNAIEIFAEGEHHIDRRVLHLKKGFARIILGTMQKYPNTPIQIIPVGINFDSHLSFPSSVSIYYGKSIDATKYINIKNPDLKFSEITKVVSTALKKLTLHVKDEINYDAIIKKLEANNVDYLNPFEANKMLENIDKLPNNPLVIKPPINWFTPIHILAKLNSIIPLLIWKKLKGKITDKLFTNTFRFGLIATLFPLFYLIQAGIIYYFFNFKYAIIYLAVCILLGIISKKTMTITSSL
jgi:1-acyl-sn-glycerol-3-phosphate acyltransferase